MGRIVRGVGSLLSLLTLLAGIPAGLAWTVGNPLPAGWPSGQQWRAWAADPLTLEFLIAAGAIIGWLLWGALVAAVLVEIFARVTRVQVPRLRLASPLQLLVAALVSSAILSVTGAAARASAPAVSVVAEQPQVAPPRASEQAAVTALSTITVHAGGQRYTYTVQRRDTLSKIAGVWLGDSGRWPEICRLNWHRHFPVGGTLRDCDLIYPGWDLILPADARPPANITALPPEHTPPAPTTTAQPSTPPSTAPQSPARSASPHELPGSDATDEQENVEPAHGVGLADGWIGLPLAAALLALAGLVWRHRRQRYVPVPITASAEHNDPPPLQAAVRLRHALRHAAPEPDDPCDATSTQEPGQSPAADTDADLSGAGDLTRFAGLGLVGPGAPGAVRALMVAALLPADAGRADDACRVVTTSATVISLLGTVDAATVAGLTIVDTVTEAVSLIEEEIIRRSRAITDAEISDAVGGSRDNARREPAGLLLVTEAPDSAMHGRIATALVLGRRTGITAAFLGGWPHGRTLTVGNDGTTAEPDEPRLAVLDARSATDALSMLVEIGPQTGTAPPVDDHVRRPPVQRVQPHPPTTQCPAAAAPATPISESPAPTGDRRVRARILGHPTVLAPDDTPLRGLRAKSLELLVYLAVEREGASLSDIMEAIWPEATLRRATERLSTCAANLRTVLRNAVEQADDAQTASDDKQRQLSPVINTGGRYHLNPAIVDVDWWNVADHWTHVAAALDDQNRLRHLRAAVAIIGGPLADETDYEWVDTPREHIRRRQIRVLAQTAQLTADDDPQQSLDLLEQACQLDPLSEELARRTIEAAHALGNADVARHRYSILRRELAEHGIAMDAETEQLASANSVPSRITATQY